LILAKKRFYKNPAKSTWQKLKVGKIFKMNILIKRRWRKKILERKLEVLPH
jgi:hypothetical protein